jgi:nucleotide-binding universal stress UspA family protein
MQIRTILVAIDDSPHAAEALRWGESLAQKCRAQLLLLHVLATRREETSPPESMLVSPSPASYEAMAPGIWTRHQATHELEAQARATLQAFAQRHLSRPVSAQVRVAVGKPAEQILRVAHEAGVDLIVMGTHGRTGWRHAVLGSVAEAVLRQALCPVFTVGIGERQSSATACPSSSLQAAGSHDES